MTTKKKLTVDPDAPISMRIAKDTGEGRSRGWHAAEDGKGRDACPFPIGHPHRPRWMKGWWDFHQGIPVRRPPEYRGAQSYDRPLGRFAA